MTGINFVSNWFDSAENLELPTFSTGSLHSIDSAAAPGIYSGSVTAGLFSATVSERTGRWRHMGR